MKIEIAYQVANLVDKHVEAEKLARKWQKLRDHESVNDDDDARSITLPLDLQPDNPSSDVEDFELQGQNEINLFLDFVVDIARRRQRDLEVQLDKIHPHLEAPSRASLTVLYETYVEQLCEGLTPRPFEQVLLSDIMGLNERMRELCYNMPHIELAENLGEGSRRRILKDQHAAVA